MATFIGHINCTFAENKVTTVNRSSPLNCPFNLTHKITFEDFFLHLERCPDAANKKDTFEVCAFNPVHYCPSLEGQKDIHLKVCPNRREVPWKTEVVKVVKPKEVKAQLLPLRERRGIENPRFPQQPIPDIRSVLGPDVRFPELEQLVAERKNAKILDPAVYTDYNELNAYEYVLKYGVDMDGFAHYDQFTRRMSRAEKATFANFLLEQKDKEYKQLLQRSILRRNQEFNASFPSGERERQMKDSI